MSANALPCVEIRHYRAAVIDRRYVVTYEQRGPGETDWQPVRLSRTARPEDAPPVVRIAGAMIGRTFGDTVTARAGWLELRSAHDKASAHAKRAGGPELDVVSSDHPAVVRFLQDVAALFDRHAVD